MEKMQNQQKFQMPHNKSYYAFCFIVAAILTLSTFFLLFFLPDLFFNFNTSNPFDSSSWTYIQENYVINGTVAQRVSLGFFWFFTLIMLIIAYIGFFILIKQMLMLLQWRTWWTKYMNGCTQIINSCDVSKLSCRVAMVVCTCNDVLPYTIKQSANQTYKNMDVWISDDSTNPQIIEQIDKFCNENGFHVLHRDPAHKKQHPTKIGNLYYFLEKYGNQYDYIFENDSSSLVTPNFVANGLCFFNSPLLDHSKDGAIIANGSFSGIQTVLPYLYSRCTRIAEATGMVGATVALTGHPVQLNGWGALYKVSTLKQIPLNKVECPSCDMTRGLWLTINKYNNYLNPFDFTTKLCPPNAEGIKNQWLKWTGGDVFSVRQKLTFGHIPFILRPFVRLSLGSKVFILPLAFVIGIASTINMLFLNFSYINWTSIICIILLYVLVICTLFIVCAISKVHIPSLILFFIFYGLMGASTGYKIVCQTFKCFITKKWSSGAVTIKGVYRANAKQKLKMGRFEYIIIVCGLLICTLLHLLCPQLNRFLIWFITLMFIIAPSVLYIIWIWVGDIPVKKGWSPEQKLFEFWKDDFRFELIKESEIWKKQHNLWNKNN